MRNTRRVCCTDRTMRDAMSDDEVAAIDAYWRAANYLSVGQIYLLDNPLLTQPLSIEHVKPRLLGHWGTTPGLNFVYAHLNRAIRQRDLSMLLITGPGHGGPGIVANAYLEGTYSEVYPSITRDAAGMKKLFKQFSFPGGIPSHVAAETPGSIHEGGELGYSLSHAYGAAFDNPSLVVACVIGDGEAETGPLATSWHSNKFLNPRGDGAVLPILHLNGYKIANPTLLARIDDGGAGSAAERLRTSAVLRRGFGSRCNAPADGGDSRRRARRDSSHSERRACRQRQGPAALAGDRAALTERVDRAGTGRWSADRGPLAFASGAVVEPRGESGAPGATGTMAPELPAERAVRRTRRTANDVVGARTARHAPPRRHAVRERRIAIARPAPSGCARPCGHRRKPRRARRRVDACDGTLSARRAEPERGSAQLPHRRTRRDRVEPAERRVRRDVAGVDGRDRADGHEPGRARSRDGDPQ